MQEMQVQSLIPEDPISLKQLSLCATTIEPMLQSPGVRAQEPVLCNQRVAPTCSN